MIQSAEINSDSHFHLRLLHLFDPALPFLLPVTLPPRSLSGTSVLIQASLAFVVNNSSNTCGPVEVSIVPDF